MFKNVNKINIKKLAYKLKCRTKPLRNLLLSMHLTCWKMMSVRIFVTGGTFDKEYDELTGRLFFNKSHLREMLELGRSKIDLNISTLMMKDSFEMDELIDLL
ncbi:MAG: hypothetical protein Ct9H90mP7_2350 [Candidatus Neomarinimicrobiota bacterium]|nr:MAG: hypothetical protein Ct9H90mP7_2350 [Candidatus Neomarinimicrobiota bacterium]